jgi:hypothetical protein
VIISALFNNRDILTNESYLKIDLNEPSSPEIKYLFINFKNFKINKNNSFPFELNLKCDNECYESSFRFNLIESPVELITSPQSNIAHLNSIETLICFNCKDNSLIKNKK